MTIYKAHLKSNNQLQAIKIIGKRATESEREREKERDKRESAESVLDKPAVGH